MGHCEPASGIAGIMKCVLALEHRLRPPLQELEKINPNRKSIARKAARALCVDTEQSISGQEHLKSYKKVRRGQMVLSVELA